MQNIFNRLTPPQILIIGFVGVILIGSILLNTPWAVKEGNPDFLTSLFTATSAVCVTGLVVVDTGTHWTAAGQIIIMLLFQIGGLGVMAFATSFALILGKRIRLKHRLAMQQSLNTPLGTIVDIFKHLLIFSFTLELVGTVLLWIYWIPLMGWKQALWYGLFHAVSAFNNAGFDLFGNFSSLTAFVSDVPVSLIISTLFIIGSLGFLVNYEIYNYRNTRRLSLHSKLVLVTVAFLIIGGTILVFALEYNNTLSELSPGAKVLAAYFQSATKTCGFATLDTSSTLLPTQWLLMLLMFIGGGPGSTSGGIKVTTFAIIWLTVLSVIRGRNDIEVMERRIPVSDVHRSISVTAIGFTLVFVVTFVLSLTHQGTFNSMLFEAVSAVGTVGLSLGLTPELSSIGRIIIIISMFLGRVGPLTFGYALANRQAKIDIRYPEERIMIG